MRFFLLIIAFTWLLLQVSLAGNAQQVTMHKKNVSLSEIFQLVKDQTGYSVVSNSSALSSIRVSVRFENAKIEEVFSACLAGLPYSFRIVDNNIFIRHSPEKIGLPSDTLQERIITGRIVDVAGNPQEGVTVRTDDDDAMVISDVQGLYRITVSDRNQSLHFSSLGYVDLSVAIRDRQVVDVTMEDYIANLDAVVVTALGISKEAKRLGYAVQEIESSALSSVPTNNFMTQLSGKVAGLTVFNTPNLMQQTKVEMRGREPLMVVDGIPVSSNTYDINAMDVAQVTVLKGATAAALYGSKGQNGAIQITTKTAKQGTSVELSQRTIFRAGWIVFPETQTQYGNGEQGKYAFVDGKGNGIFDNDFVWGPKLDVKDPSTPSGYWETAQWDSPLDADGNRIPTPFVSRGKNNLSDFLEKGYTASNNLAISSAGEKTNVRLGVGYDYTHGEVPNTALKNYSLSFNVSSQATDRLQLTASIQYNKQDSPNFPRINYGNTNILYGMLIWAGPDVDMRDFSNYWKPGREGYEQVYFNYSWINNPHYMAHEQQQRMNRDKLFGVASADYKLNESLSATIRQSAEVIGTKDEMTYPFGYIGANAIKGNYELKDRYIAEYNTDAFLKYQSQFGKFGISGFVGGSINFRENTLHESKTQGLQVPGVYNLSNSAGPVLSTNALTQYARNSLFASADLSWDDTYFLSMTERIDVSSALPKDHNVYSYPSVAGSVILSNILGLPSSSFLKARGSWAMVRADLSPYQYTSYYNPSITYDGINTVTYGAVLGNAALRPQKTNGYELGLNGSLFRGRFHFDGTVYQYRDSESIYDQNASVASGFSKYKINGNKFNRYGIELTVGTDLAISPNIAWSSGINWSLNRFTLAEIHGGADNLSGIRVGERVDKYMTNNTMKKAPDGQLIIGANGLPVRDTEMKSFGHIGPDWTASWHNNFLLWNHFTVGFLLEARVGGNDQANINRQMWYSGVHPDAVGPDRDAYNRGEAYLADGVNEVTDAQGNTNYVVNTYTTNYRSFTEQYRYRMNGESNLFDMSFLKMREMVIGYELPEDKLARFGMDFLKSLSFSVVGSNLFILSSFPLSDPDEGNGGTVGNRLQFPSARNIGFNLNVKF